MGNFASRNFTFRALLAATALLAVTAVRAQNITVTAANASNDAIYDVTFNNTGGGSITILNTDGGSLHNLVSLAFYPNPSTLQLDLLAADNGGTIVRYPGNFQNGSPTKGKVIFAAGGSGPANPDALSVDAAGNLYVTNSKSGTASNPQLWVLPADGAGGFGPPVLIDASYPTQSLQETLVVGTTVVPPNQGQAVLNPGDLLVLTSNPGAVLRYAGNNGSGPLSATAPTTLITLPVGTVPGGLAFWPADNSLLVTTSRGTVYQYHLTPNETPTPFAGNLGNGQFKIKTGVQSGQPFAYIANNNGGDILQFGGPNQLLATVTSGVQHPQGLAVTNAAYAPVTNCQGQNGCDLLGGKVITHEVPPTVSINGNIIENVCVVPVDPRLAQANSCTTSLQVSQVCGGYSDKVFIPPSLCGGSGPSGKGFALVKTQTQAYAQGFPFNGQLIFNDTNLPNVLPSAGNPLCNPPDHNTMPLGTLAWAPLTGEGKVVEVEPNGYDMLELTAGCDGQTSRNYGMSLFGLGFALNTSVTGGPVGFTTGKYNSLVTTIQDQITEGAIAALVNPMTTAPGNFTYLLQQCVSTSQGAFSKGLAYYDGAALQLLAADQHVAAVASLAADFTANSDYPNPSGALRSRLENLYYTINTRLRLNTAGALPPGAVPPDTPPPPPAPTISGNPPTTAKAGSAYTFQPTSADFAGNTGTLSFSIAGLPSWATFSTTTGKLSGVAVKGTYPGIVISVTDGCSGASLPPFTITVSPGGGKDH
jgi:sugar lactone lactonase YvrE